MAFLRKLKERAAGQSRRIVLAEGDDERVRDAALRLQEAGHIDPILLVPDSSFDGPVGWKGTVRSPIDDPELDRYAELYREIHRKGSIDATGARQRMADPLYFAGLMVRAGDADGAVAGAAHATADVIRAALESVGKATDARMVSGAFYMVVPSFRGTPEHEVLTFADAGVIPNPDAEGLLEIAVQAARK